jgi:glyoxylase-like metal-dependent hydrolase (beta-lactamase superfamily II)
MATTGKPLAETTFICKACGTQYPPSDMPPAACLICEDERQYVPPGGQQWLRTGALAAAHRNDWREEEPGLSGIGVTPEIAIGQRALLLRTPEGNILWDCVPFLDDATRDRIATLGGLRAIAISHPHFYTAMIEWSRAFDNAPIYLHAANRPWVVRHDPAIVFFEQDRLPLFGGVTLQRCGGHFPGSTVLHWADGADGAGALLTADTLYVLPDLKHVTFMYSFPNQIPLRPASVRGVIDTIADLQFDRVYSGWFGRVITSGGHAAVRLSAERYCRALE